MFICILEIKSIVKIRYEKYDLRGRGGGGVFNIRSLSVIVILLPALHIVFQIPDNEHVSTLTNITVIIVLSYSDYYE